MRCLNDPGLECNGLGVWGLRFGVCGLELSVQGLEFGVRCRCLVLVEEGQKSGGYNNTDERKIRGGRRGRGCKRKGEGAGSE